MLLTRQYLMAYEGWHSRHYPKWLYTNVLEELDKMDLDFNEGLSRYSGYLFLKDLRLERSVRSVFESPTLQDTEEDNALLEGVDVLLDCIPHVRAPGAASEEKEEEEKEAAETR